MYFIVRVSEDASAIPDWLILVVVIEYISNKIHNIKISLFIYIFLIY